jgi:hypothetical protein
MYSKLDKYTKEVVQDTSLLSQVTNSGHLERTTVQTIRYKDYYGAIEVDVETNKLYGRVFYIQDLVTFKAETVEQAKIEFAKSVDDYLEFCQELKNEGEL